MERDFQRVVQEAVAEVAALYPWMNEADVGLVAGEVVDVAVMAAALSGLAQRAGIVGDRRRAWAFEQWCQWACESMRGEEYHWPDLPAELAGLA